jgi:uncharacterized protein (DUF1800 family)
MPQPRLTRARFLYSVITILLVAPVAALAQPAVTSVLSRMSHGALNFDLPLPQSGPGGIECRSLANGLTVVVSFDRTVTAGTAAVSAGAATVNGQPTFSGQTMHIPLTGVANAQQVTLTLTDVADNLGGTLASATVSFRVLEGDVNANGAVSVADLNLAKARMGQPVNYGSYRADVTADGAVSINDVNLVKARVNTTVTGGPTPNSPPTITDITNQATAAGAAMSPVQFTVGDAESGPENLYVSATCSNLTLVPQNSITVGGAGAARNLSLTPSATQVGIATISVSVSDGLATTIDTFQIAVSGPEKLYLTTLRPENPSVLTPASGTAILLVNGTETAATLRVTYSNLTTNRVAWHIHGPADPGENGGILFDIDTAAQAQDGSYAWTFTPVGGGIGVPEIVAAIKAGRTYLNIHTAKFPAGEIRGHFQLAAGSQTFTPPPPPPPLPTDPPTDQDAARLLIQATFGPTSDDIEMVKTMGYDAWLEQQFAQPTTPMLDIVKARVAEQVSPANALSGQRITDAWWRIALTGNDQLRQRVAMAYSEIFVVSKVEESIDGQPAGLCSYHDMLANRAFDNFRDLLRDVTLHPVMGQYLNMRGNRKPVSPNFTPPNENYAREVQQLFSVGLNLLHPDGTLKLGADGLPIPTYSQDTIESFAHVFTGWDLNQTAVVIPYWDGTQMLNNNSLYINPMVVTASRHSNNAKTLLNYPGAKYQIPANASQTAASSNAELEFALDNIFNHPNVGPFIARRLIQRLVCSNPSPGYVYRVAQVFNDNGSGVRGDMKAVVKTLLTDYEARTTDTLGNLGWGKLKEPILRVSQVVRALHPSSNAATPVWRLPQMDADMGQTVYRSPTVFNFFEPDYVYPGTIAQAGLSSPEFQIVTENTTILTANVMKRGIVDNAVFGPSGGVSDVRINLATEAALAPTPDALLDHLNRILMAGQMPQNMRDRIKTYMLTTADNARRARGAVYLIATSPQFATQK